MFDDVSFITNFPFFFVAFLFFLFTISHTSSLSLFHRVFFILKSSPIFSLITIHSTLLQTSFDLLASKNF